MASLFIRYAVVILAVGAALCSAPIHAAKKETKIKEFDVEGFNPFGQLQRGVEFSVNTIERIATADEIKREKEIKIIHEGREKSKLRTVKTAPIPVVREANNPDGDKPDEVDPQIVTRTEKFIKSDEKQDEKRDEKGRDLAVFLPDQRVTVDSYTFPGYVVGQLWSSDNGALRVCTGALVGSRYTVITAGHCVKNTPEFWNTARFIPGYRSKTPGLSTLSYTGFGIAKFTKMYFMDTSTGATEPPQNVDTAVLLAKPISSTWPNGFLGWLSYANDSTFAKTIFNVSMISYPGDSPGVGKYQAKCASTGGSGVDVYHSCSNPPGSSGASIYNSKNQVILVNKSGIPGKLSTYDNSNANWASPLRPMAGYIKAVNGMTP